MTYDEFATTYDRFVDEAFTNPNSILYIAHQEVLKILGDVHGLSVCDLACGTGRMAAYLSQTAISVTGTDFSKQLLDIAQTRHSSPNLNFIHDDAQHLNHHEDSAYDRVICCFALMDIPNLPAVYTAVNRVLKPDGRFVFAITHPCFQSPHASHDEDARGMFRRVYQYTQEGQWYSENKHGIRGQVGAHHRTISTYLNGLIRADFVLDELSEPTNDNEIPAVLVVSAHKNR